jgi:hypothetical protein
MTLKDEPDAMRHTAVASGDSAASGADRPRSERPLTAGMTVLAILVSVGSLCAASAADALASTALSWLLAAGVTALMLGGLYAVGTWEKKAAIRLTPWLRAGIMAWIVVGAPAAVGLQTHFRYAPSHLWSGATTLLALLAIPLGIAGTVTLSEGQSRWLSLLLSLLYAGVALFLSFFVGLIVAGLHGDAL